VAIALWFQTIGFTDADRRLERVRELT
jgi:hypothetical protein